MDPININYAILALSAVIVLLLVMIPMCNTTSPMVMVGKGADFSNESPFSGSIGSNYGKWRADKWVQVGAGIPGATYAPIKPGRGNFTFIEPDRPTISGPIIVAAPGTITTPTYTSPGNPVTPVNAPFTGPIMAPSRFVSRKGGYDIVEPTPEVGTVYW